MASPVQRRSVPSSKVQNPETVSPAWLLKALGLCIAGAVVLAYASVCLLVFLGGRQLLLHPSHQMGSMPGEPFQSIRFDAAATGTPRLSGWWIPADSSTARTVLYLHDGNGALGANAPKLNLLHRAGVNIFAIDYRGFGESDSTSATEARMHEDAEAALTYLTETRHLAATLILPYGEGLGAVLAANLASEHTNLPGLIIDSPDPDAFARISGDARTRWLPMHLLIPDHFDLRGALANARQPKLLLADGPFGFEAERVRINQALFATIPGPRLTVFFGNPHSEDAYLQSVGRFLDENVKVDTH